MENVASTDQPTPTPVPESQANRALRLELKDVGDLDQILRGYYLGQIRQIDGRRERRLARKLIEDHLVLPKSRQRTSKDAAYIREVLGIGVPLLAQLEESRLIRRLNKSGQNPIYEVSHDSLVEPILAERSNHAAIWAFLRKYGRWFLLLLLLLFVFGMWFESQLGLLHDGGFRLPASSDQVLEAEATNEIFAERGTHRREVLVPLSSLPNWDGEDSTVLRIAVDVTAYPDLDPRSGRDTVALDLGALNLNLPREALQRLLSDGGDTAIPLRLIVPLGTTDTSSNLMADVAGATVLRIGSTTSGPGTTPRGGDNVPLSAARRLRNDKKPHLEADLGRESVQATTRARTVALDTLVYLSDLIKDDEAARALLENRKVRLTYQVDVSAAPTPTQKVEYVPVSGIEVQYSDGTRRFIPGNPGSESQPVTHTVQPGETLYKISRLYDVSPAQLRELNQLPDNQIKVGQVLRIK